MDNQKVFHGLIFGFTSGIFVSSFFKMGFSFFLLLITFSSLIYLYAKLLTKSKSGIILVAIFLFSFSIGILRYEIKEVARFNGNISSLVGEKISLTGVVSDEPSIKDQSVQLVVTADLSSISGKNLKGEQKILVSVGLFPEFKYGDLVEVLGKLEKPADFTTDTGSSFDYTGYLAKDDIYYQISFAQAKYISSGHGSFIKNILFAFKNAFTDKLNLVIKEPESALLSGLLLGSKNSLGKDLQNDFRLAGVSHIVALSGYNITIVAMGIMAALVFLPRTLSLSFGVLGIILFAIMTGGTATVMRASIMALLVLLAKGTNRKYDITRALLLAGVFMLIQNPKILVFDISFQLSFLSTIALIYVSPLIEKRMTFITEKYELRELMVATVATQIFVLPFILYKMGLFSVYALISNILILPFIPIIMLLGFIIGIFGFVSTVVTIPVAFICSLFLSYALKVIEVVAHLPLSSVMIKNFPFGLVIFIYLIFFIIISRSQVKPSQRVSLY